MGDAVGESAVPDAPRKGDAYRWEGAWPPVLFAAPQFRLTDQRGQEFGSTDLAGRVWVANFIFTRCPATCPRQTEKIAELQRHSRRWPDRDRVRLISFTVDPEHDTSAELRAYADRHGAEHDLWRFLTGKRAALWSLSKEGFKLPVANGAADSNSPITHSAQFILVDSRLRVRGFYDGLSDDEFAKLVADMRVVLSESDPHEQNATHVAVPAELFESSWMVGRAASQLASRSEITALHDFWFEDRLLESGITFVSRPVADVARNYRFNHYDHACGMAAADVDGDGLVDLLFVNQVGGNELWRNLGGGRFENATEEAGISLAERVNVAASFADTDNDGDSDLYVTTTRHGNAFFENDGRGRFRDVTAESGLEYSGHSSGVEFFDFNNDGLLDVFVTNVGVFTSDEVAYTGDPASGGSPYFAGMLDTTAGHLFPERSERSILYRNEGNNRFVDVTEQMGLLDSGWSGDATPFDFNDDGWVDLYVLNMQGNDECYLNRNGRRFERATEATFDKPVWGGMGVKPFDFDNDGRLDLYVTNMHADMWEPKLDINGPREKVKTPYGAVPDSYLNSRFPTVQNIQGNALYRNLGDGRFEDVSLAANAENYWPWGPSVGDLNADGFPDVFIASCMNYPFRYHVNSLLLNDAGRVFRDAEFILGIEPRRDERTAVPWFELDCSGPDADHELCRGRAGRVIVWGAIGTRSAVILDLDQDGDLDIVTNDFGSEPQLLISNLAERHTGLRYLVVVLEGTRSNRDGLGARVEVTCGARTLTQIHDGQSGYLSQSSIPLYFGLGDAEHVDQVSVYWSGGGRQVLEGPIEVNQRLIVAESEVDATR